MPTCSRCGAEHDLLDPAFRRPEAFQELDRDARETYAQADDDTCRITLPGTGERYFVRGTVPVEVAGYPDGVWWGVWAEVSESAFGRILELWSDPEQGSEPPFEGRLANRVPSYPDTLGLPVTVHLTDPTSRPRFHFAPDVDHPFAWECRSGVDMHRASEWNESLVAG